MADGHWRIHRRQDVLPTSIGPITATGSLTVTGIVSASAPTSGLTVTSLSFSDGIRTETVITTPGASATTTGTSRVTNVNAATPTSTSTSTSTTSKTSNMSTLIPAIVAPVAAVLVLSFVAFWLFMRRRSKKALENEPEFVMEGMKSMKEKPRSRPITADSNSSTRELVPNKNKETMVNITEVDRAGLDNKESPFTLPKLDLSSDSRPGSRQADQSGRSKAVPNFSRGPRPNTAGRDSTASPAPFRPEDRGASRDERRPATAGAGGPRSNNMIRDQGPTGPGSRAPQRTQHPRPGSFSQRSAPSNPFNKGPVPTVNTRPTRPSQDGGLNQPPAGAYNGSSPISQYSPIVKDMPKFGTSPMATKQNAPSRPAGGSISSINDQGIRKPPPSAIKTSSSPLSPADANFSEENVRIARLANNSRLHSVVATTAATSPATEEPPTPSPRLPPPATRDAPPVNYNIPLPAHEPPAPASIQARLNGASISDRRSVVSGLSDDYVDMEVDDNKSDVSSLDEREKWQMQSETDRANSRQAGLGGYGGLGPRPPLLTAGDDSHHSDASGSQYSLGYYGKGTAGSEAR